MVLCEVKYHIYCFNKLSFSTPLKTWNSLPFPVLLTLFPTRPDFVSQFATFQGLKKNEIWFLTFSRFSLPVGSLIIGTHVCLECTLLVTSLLLLVLRSLIQNLELNLAWTQIVASLLSLVLRSLIQNLELSLTWTQLSMNSAGGIIIITGTQVFDLKLRTQLGMNST